MNVKIWIYFCAAIFFAGIIGIIVILTAPSGEEVIIVQDGRVLYHFDLSRADDQIIEILFQGRANIVEIKEGRIRMMEAECPDHLCLRMGYLKSKYLPVVCLPNRLVIEFVNMNENMDENMDENIDAVTR